MKKKFDFITVILPCLTVLILSLAFFALPDKEISEKENRTLAKFPVFNEQNLISGRFTSDLTDYISDQFPMRDMFISAKAYSELLFGKNENNGVIYGKNNTLIARDKITENRLVKNLETVKNFEKEAAKDVVLAVLPRSVDVFSENLPKTYSAKEDKSLWNDFYAKSQELNLKTPNLYTPLCEGNNYYKTDHHYTTYGAYQTYIILGDVLGFAPVGIENFKQEIASDNFCGTSMRKSGFYLSPHDKITLLRYDGDTDYTVTADGKKISLYDFSALDKTDKYSVFLGGNHARVDICSHNQKPKLLIVRDSFADSISPFLAIHYDLVLIDLRYYNDSVKQIVKDENIDAVLIFESMSEFAQSKNISYLRR